MSNRERPNIVFLLADDQSFWSTGYNGHPEAVTPNLDALASEGRVFDRHYVTSPICMASRASIATGLYEYRTGCNFEHGSMSREMFDTSYHMQLRRSGYFVGYAGKFGFGVGDGESRPYPEYYDDQGAIPGKEFDWWRGLPGQGKYRTAENGNLAHLADDHPHLTGALAASTNEFFNQADESGKPFCLTVGFKAPHGPLTPDSSYDDIYREKRFSYAENYGENGASHLSDQVKTGRQWFQFPMWEGESYHETYRLYFQLIYGLDCAVGSIREALKDRGLAGNTVLIFSSDNGYFCGSHRMGGKTLTYDEACRVPMIIHDPRCDPQPSGSRISQLSGNIDIAPTILDLAGEPIQPDIDGTSLVPLLHDSTEPVRSSLSVSNFWNMPPTQGLSVTDGTCKYIYYWYQGEGMEPSEELYCLKDDPGELQNLIDTDSPTVSEMRQAYDQAVSHIRQAGVKFNRYEHYGVLLDRNIPWNRKAGTYEKFFKKWVRSTGPGSWRGGPWFEDLDLSDFPEDVTYSYGIAPG